MEDQPAKVKYPRGRMAPLKNKKHNKMPKMNGVLCIHHNDLDGRCAAAIVYKATGYNIRFYETNYGNPLPVVKDTDNVIAIVDFSYPPDQMNELILLGRPIVWIDHHATARDYPYQHLMGLRDFEDKSRAGCELAWEFFFPDKPVPDSVRLIGDYDKWKLQYDPACFQYYEGIKTISDSQYPEHPFWQTILNHNMNTPEIVQKGVAAIDYRDQYCDGLCKSFGYETRLDGYDAYACNQYMFGSKGFGKRFEEYPICIAYIHDGKKFTVSMYSREVHVGQIAQRYGGGGHKGAAGFTCQVLPFIKINKMV